MRRGYCTFIIFSSLSLLVSSCADQAQSNQSAAMQEQQLGEGQIINIMMTVDKGEIAAAKEATKKKLSPEVDRYAKYLIEQHQRNLDNLTQLAKQLGLDTKESSISSTLKSHSKEELKALDKLQDNAFDKGFIDAMVKDHQEGLEVIDTKLLPQTKNPQLKAALEQFRQMVSDHLERGLSIQSTL